MTKRNNNGNDKKRDIYGGYSPEPIRKGYQPNDPKAITDTNNLPKGGTGQSNKNTKNTSINTKE